MKQFTIQDIRDWNPCYDPNRYLPEDWQGNALDILRHQDIPVRDKLWVVLREDLIDDKILRLFAVACVLKALSLVPNPDPRSLTACDVAERFANGLATFKELMVAKQDAATAAADYAAADAATDAAAYAAADAAAYAAADAATDAAAYAADAAAYAADAAYYVAYTIRDAARAAAREWQVTKLIELLEVA